MFEWWHWVVFGLCLVISELAVPAFFMVWFGIGATIVGLLLFVLPDLSIATQLVVWGLVSTILVTVWFRYLKPRTVTAVGTSAANVTGEVGVLVNDLGPQTRGHARFQKPILGSDIWECYAEQNIKAGERIRIVAVEGNFIKVESVK